VVFVRGSCPTSRFIRVFFRLMRTRGRQPPDIWFQVGPWSSSPFPPAYGIGCCFVPLWGMDRFPLNLFRSLSKIWLPALPFSVGRASGTFTLFVSWPDKRSTGPPTPWWVSRDRPRSDFYFLFGLKVLRISPFPFSLGSSVPSLQGEVRFS